MKISLYKKIKLGVDKNKQNQSRDCLEMLFWKNLLNFLFSLPGYHHYNNLPVTKAPHQTSKS